MRDRLEPVFHLALVCAIGVLTAGCVAGSRQARLPDPSPLGREFTTMGETPADPADGAPGPTDAITLKEALALAMAGNPELEAFIHAARAAEARVLQAGRVPNPRLELEIEEFDRGGGGFDSAESAVALGQVLELGGKRSSRRRIARAQGELAGWDYETKRLDVFTSTVRRFVAVIAAQRRLDLARSAVELAEKTNRAVGERVKAGKESPLQSSRTSAELEMARISLNEAENDVDVSKVKLASLWGVELPHFRKARGDMDIIAESVPPIEVLLARLAVNPDLARWDAELRLRAAALSSAKAARVPDLKASVGFQRFEEDGTDSFAFGIGVPLPLFDRNQGNIAAAECEIAKARAERRAAESALAAELTAAHAALSAAHSRAQTLRSKVLPAMEGTFVAAREGYGQGKFNFLDMLDAQRGLIEARGALVDALSGYHGAVAKIQRITGTSIEGLLDSNPETE
jgi:outer membrane protein, heavy metal efflux system